MANEQNLKPIQKGGLSSEEAKRRGANGGIASGVARRRAKTTRELASLIANSPIQNAKLKKKIQDNFGLADEDLTGNMAVIAGIYNEAIKGSVKAADKWDEWTEVKESDNRKFLIPAELLGKDYVDINREIEPNKTYIFKGGRGSLKSSYISLKIVELLKNNPNMHVCVCRKIGNTLKDSVYAQIKWAIRELKCEDEFTFIKNPIEITYKKTGQKIYFRGADDPLKLKSIKPEFGYIGILWIEELDQINGEEEERSINQSVIRGGNESYVFESYNPPKTLDAWVNRKEIEINPRRVIHHSTYLDAPKDWLGQKFIDDAEHLKEVNQTAYEHEYLGVPNGTGGAVFENLEIREITDAEIKTFEYIFGGVDWGWYPDPFCFERVAYVSSQETLYIFGEISGNKMPNADTAAAIKKAGWDDYRITCDSAEPKSVNDYRDLGLPAVPAEKGAGSIDYSFKWLCVRKIVIDPQRAPRAAEEFTNYEYERDKEGNVVRGYPDKNNHAIDAVRYATESYWKRRGNQA